MGELNTGRRITSTPNVENYLVEKCGGCGEGGGRTEEVAVDSGCKRRVVLKRQKLDVGRECLKWTMVNERGSAMPNLPRSSDNRYLHLSRWNIDNQTER